MLQAQIGGNDYKEFVRNNLDSTRLESTSAKFALIKPGSTDTPMTSHLKQQGNRFAGVEDIEGVIVKAIDLEKPVIYAPAKWALIKII